MAAASGNGTGGTAAAVPAVAAPVVAPNAGGAVVAALRGAGSLSALLQPSAVVLVTAQAPVEAAAEGES